MNRTMTTTRLNGALENVVDLQIYDFNVEVIKAKISQLRHHLSRRL